MISWVNRTRLWSCISQGFTASWLLFCCSFSNTCKEISVEEHLAGAHKKSTNALMQLYVCHSFSSSVSLYSGLAPSQMFPWCPCWQRWWGSQCSSVWSCGMWRSSEGPPEGYGKWIILQWIILAASKGCFLLNWLIFFWRDTADSWKWELLMSPSACVVLMGMHWIIKSQCLA